MSNTGDKLSSTTEWSSHQQLHSLWLTITAVQKFSQNNVMGVWVYSTTHLCILNLIIMGCSAVFEQHAFLQVWPTGFFRGWVLCCSRNLMFRAFRYYYWYYLFNPPATFMQLKISKIPTQSCKNLRGCKIHILSQAWASLSLQTSASYFAYCLMQTSPHPL